MIKRVVLLLLFIRQLVALKILIVSFAGAGHVTPIFELTKALNHHQITFVTQKFAQDYVDLRGYVASNPSFNLIYTNDLPEIAEKEKLIEQTSIDYMMEHSLIEAIGQIGTMVSELTIPLLNRTIHLLMIEKFDVIIGGAMIIGLERICEIAKTPCVFHKPALVNNLFGLNTPNTLALLDENDLRYFPYRAYNLIFNCRVIMKMFSKIVKLISETYPRLPRIPGPFVDVFNWKNLFQSNPKYLLLISAPTSFYPFSTIDPSVKYLGGFIDPMMEKSSHDELLHWIQSKPNSSIIYGAFGSSSVISAVRMSSLIRGLARFLIEKQSSFLLLAFRSVNYETYRSVINELLDQESMRTVWNDASRVRIENGFVPQKWILRHSSVHIFLTHAGFGSLSESIYFEKATLCMPFNMDQFANAIRIRNLNLGRSLFEPPSLWKSLKKPYHHIDYRFTEIDVSSHLSILWLNQTYQRANQLMSSEMKYLGGVQQAVKEIEYYHEFSGSFDRFIPLTTTLKFYQQYFLDLISFFLILPLSIFLFLSVRCCKQNRKEKTD